MKIKFKIMSFIYVTFLAFALVSCDTNTENSNESEAVDNTVTTDATKETEEEKQEETEEEIQEETQEDILNIDTNSEEYIAILDYFETVRETKWTRKSAIEYFTDNGISKEVIEYIIENEQTMDWNDSISYFYNSGILEGVSSKELIELFRKELFTEEEIQYAIDNASVITQEHINAYKSAKTYAQMMNMSKQGVYDQITSSFGDNFSPEVAQLAVEYLDVDWNKNALESAKTYYNLMQMSSQAVYEQLVSPYGGQFTKEEAQYAIDNLSN